MRIVVVRGALTKRWLVAALVIAAMAVLAMGGIVASAWGARASHAEEAEGPLPMVDGERHLYPDLVISLLRPTIDHALWMHYRTVFKEMPGYAVYYGSGVAGVERPNGGRSERFIVEVEVTPYFGPHLSVGRDRMRIEVGCCEGRTEVIAYAHLEDHPLPEWYWDHYVTGRPPEGAHVPEDATGDGPSPEAPRRR